MRQGGCRARLVSHECELPEASTGRENGYLLKVGDVPQILEN